MIWICKITLLKYRKRTKNDKRLKTETDGNLQFIVLDENETNFYKDTTNKYTNDSSINTSLMDRMDRSPPSTNLIDIKCIYINFNIISKTEAKWKLSTSETSIWYNKWNKNASLFISKNPWVLL